MKTDVEARRLVSPVVFAVKILKGKKKKNSPHLTSSLSARLLAHLSILHLNIVEASM